MNVNGTSKLTRYEIRMDLEINGMLEEGTRTANIIAGSIVIRGNGLFNPIYEYQIINGTFNVGQSTL